MTTKPLTHCYPVPPVTIPQAIGLLLVVVVGSVFLAPLIVILGVLDAIIERI